MIKEKNTKLDIIREKIDHIDKGIINLLAKRMILSKRVGKIKLKNGLSIWDNKREKEVLNNIILHAQKAGLDLEFIKKLMKMVINESIRIQKELNALEGGRLIRQLAEKP